MLPVAVLAGGLGTRVRHLTGGTLPKALLPVAGRPFIAHKLDELRRHGVARVVMLVGHGADQLMGYIGDGSDFGIDVEFVDDGDRLLGTAGAVRRALPVLGDAFFVTYGDTLLDVPVATVEERLLGSPCDGVMTVLRNCDRWETSNVDVSHRLVVGYEKPARPARHAYLDYGFLAFHARCFRHLDDASPCDLRRVIDSLIVNRSLAAVVVQRRFHDVGNETALRATEAWLRGRH
jgi:NDP-sugar pyrophosphorylase family protein